MNLYLSAMFEAMLHRAKQSTAARDYGRARIRLLAAARIYRWMIHSP